MEQKGPGQFRQKQVFVGKRYTPPPSRELRACLANFEEYLLQPANSPDPLIRAFIAHYQFEAIHPFEDGNGRIGRILLTLMICRDLRLSEPWINLSSFFERHRREYYDKLLTVSTHGDWDEWIGFCLEGATSEAESATAIALRLSELRTALQETHEKLTPRAFEIIDHLFEFPVIDVMGLAAALGVAYNTARADIDKFVKAGILTEAKRSHPREYRADQIMRIAFPADD